MGIGCRLHQPWLTLGRCSLQSLAQQLSYKHRGAHDSEPHLQLAQVFLGEEPTGQCFHAQVGEWLPLGCLTTCFCSRSVVHTKQTHQDIISIPKSRFIVVSALLSFVMVACFSITIYSFAVPPGESTVVCIPMSCGGQNKLVCLPSHLAHVLNCLRFLHGGNAVDCRDPRGWL